MIKEPLGQTRLVEGAKSHLMGISWVVGNDRGWQRNDRLPTSVTEKALTKIKKDRPVQQMKWFPE